MHVLSKLFQNDLVVGLPKLSFDLNKVCDACVKGKHKKSSFKSKNCVSTSRPLQLLHIDLFGSTRTSLGGKSYGFVIVDDFSSFTWVLFLSSKNEALNLFTPFCKIVQNEKKVILFQALEVIMEKNLKILVLMYFVVKMELAVTSLLLELLNKMG